MFLSHFGAISMRNCANVQYISPHKKCNLEYICKIKPQVKKAAFCWLLWALGHTPYSGGSGAARRLSAGFNWPYNLCQHQALYQVNLSPTAWFQLQDNFSTCPSTTPYVPSQTVIHQILVHRDYEHATVRRPFARRVE